VLYGLARTAQPLGDRVLVTAASIAAGVGRELAIEIEVVRRLRTIEQERQRRDPAVDDFREIYEELLSIAQTTSDHLLRDRLLGVCDRLASQIKPTRGPTPVLTCREREVLTRIALGHTNIEVAEQLSIMPTTVKTYLKNTMRKLGTRNRVETIHAARCTGLLG
jgi:DNA-binding CsgD family transcriptional regulator